MDFRTPVETLIPGVQGRVLGVLTRTDEELTMRTVAQLADVSAQQASVVIGRLVELGLVERRDVPPVALVRLSSENVGARLVAELARLWQRSLDRLTKSARKIRPEPESLIVFGSFARGEATASSDIDVLAVRPTYVPAGDDAWTASLGAWADATSRELGNAVNIVEVGLDQVAEMMRHDGPPVWVKADQEGLLLLGRRLHELPSVSS